MSAHTARVKKARQLLPSGLAIKSIKIHLEAQRFTSSSANKAEICASLFAKSLKKKNMNWQMVWKTLTVWLVHFAQN